MRRSRRIARNTSVQVIGEVVGKIGLLLLFAVMARELGTDGFGEFIFAVSLALILTLYGAFGVDDILARDVAVDPSALDRHFWSAMGLKGLIGGAGVAIATGVALFGDLSATVRVAVVVLALAGFLELMTTTLYAVLQGLNDLAPEAVSLTILRLSRTVLGIVVLALGGGVVAISVVYLMGAILAAAYVVGVVLRRGIRPRVAPTKARAWYIATAAFPIGLSGLFLAVLFRIDVLILAGFKGDVDVGLYGAATRLVEGTLFLSFAFVAAVFPFLSQADRQTTPSVTYVFESACKVLATAVLPVALTIIAFAEPLTRIAYGSDYSDAVSAIRLLGGTVFLVGLTQLCVYTLISQQRQALLPWAAAAVSIVNVVANLIVIPRYSFEGAAAVGLASEALFAVVLLGAVSGVVGRVSIRRIALGPVVASGAMIAVAVVTDARLEALIPSLLVYGAVLFALEQRVHPEDVQRARQALIRT